MLTFVKSLLGALRERAFAFRHEFAAHWRSLAARPPRNVLYRKPPARHLCGVVSGEPQKRPGPARRSRFVSRLVAARVLCRRSAALLGTCALSALLALSGCQSHDDNTAPGPVDGGPARASSETILQGEQLPETSAPSCGEGRNVPIAAGLRIRELALYQTVKVSLYADGSWVAARSAPIVQGKGALLRVFVDTEPGYRPHAIRGLLTLQNGERRSTLSSERTLATSSTDENSLSTFSFRIPGALLGSATQLRVELQEPDCAAPSADAAAATYPAAGGFQELSATEVGRLRVVIVPVSIYGRLPLTTESELVRMRDTLEAYYPVQRVELSVRRPIILDRSVGPDDGETWGEMLNEILKTRMEDAVEDDVYYLGLMQPAATHADYCDRACQIGLAPQVKVQSPFHQGALVASFADAQTYEAIVHELAHAHGCGHAPCSRGAAPEGEDPNFPDKTGGIGGWGWDARKDLLIPPTHKDIMGYCATNWIGAYHYNAIALRARAVNMPVGAQASTKARQRYRQLLWHGDGSARWGGDIELGAEAELEWADALDADGQRLDRVQIARVTLSRTDTQLVYLPALDSAWQRLRIAGRELSLATILPAR